MTSWRTGPGRVRVAVTVGAAGAAVVWVVARLTGPLEVPLQLADRYWADDPVVPGQVAERGALDTTVLIAVEDAPSWLRLVTGIHPLMTLLALAAGAWALAGVLRTTAAGRPLEARNRVRLPVLAGAVLLGGLLAPVADAAARGLVVDRLQVVGTLEARPDLAPLPVLVAAALIGWAEAVRRGARAARPALPRVPTG